MVGVMESEALAHISWHSNGLSLWMLLLALLAWNETRSVPVFQPLLRRPASYRILVWCGRARLPCGLELHLAYPQHGINAPAVQYVSATYYLVLVYQGCHG